MNENPPTSLIASVTPSKSPGGCRPDTGPVRPARLLVREEGQHDVARGLAAGAHPLPYDREGHRVHVLHVDGAPAPDTAVRDLPGERVVRPVGRVGRDHVGVPVDEQGGPGGVLALDARDGGSAALVRLEDLRLETDLGELLRHVLGGEPLTGARVVAVVAGVDPDQVTTEVHDLLLGVPDADGLARAALAHAASFRCRCGAPSHPPAPTSHTQGRASPVTHRSQPSGRDRAPSNVCYGFPRRNGHGPARQTPCPGGGMADALA